MLLSWCLPARAVSTAEQVGVLSSSLHRACTYSLLPVCLLCIRWGERESRIYTYVYIHIYSMRLARYSRSALGTWKTWPLRDGLAENGCTTSWRPWLNFALHGDAPQTLYTFKFQKASWCSRPLRHSSRQTGCRPWYSLTHTPAHAEFYQLLCVCVCDAYTYVCYIPLFSLLFAWKKSAFGISLPGVCVYICTAGDYPQL